MTTPDERRSEILPTDPFDLALSDKLGQQESVHTPTANVQDVDFYGNVTTYVMQTVRGVTGTTVFVTQVNAQGSARYVLPPKVLAVISRQQDAVTAILRRRQGKRLALAAQLEGRVTTFTPEQRRKALATRKAKAAARKARKARKARG